MATKNIFIALSLPKPNTQACLSPTTAWEKLVCVWGVLKWKIIHKQAAFIPLMASNQQHADVSGHLTCQNRGGLLLLRLTPAPCSSWCLCRASATCLGKEKLLKMQELEIWRGRGIRQQFRQPLGQGTGVRVHTCNSLAVRAGCHNEETLQYFPFAEPRIPTSDQLQEVGTQQGERGGRRSEAITQGKQNKFPLSVCILLGKPLTENIEEVVPKNAPVPTEIAAGCWEAGRWLCKKPSRVIQTQWEGREKFINISGSERGEIAHTSASD